MSEPTSQPEQGPVDLPTGEPIPAAAAPVPTSTPSSQPPPSSSKPRTTPILTHLLSLPTKTDAFLAHLQRCLATPSGIDTILLFLCYTTRLTGALANSASHSLLNRNLVALALTLPRGGSPSTPATVILTTKTLPLSPRHAALAALAALLAARLKALSGLASEARTIARLWGLLNMYSWAKRLVLRPAGSATPAAALVDWTQLVACTAFQALENGAYLSSKKIMGWTPAQQGRAMMIASRWLGLFTGLEIGKLLATMLAAAQKEKKKKKSGAGDGEEKQQGEIEESKSEEEDRVAMEAVRRSMAINLAWTPLTLHWAAETGFLSDLAVGLGGCVPGILQMRKLWKDTAL